MDLQSIKLDLIRWLSDMKDPETLKQIRDIKNSRDWRDDISEEVRTSIDIGIAELDNGEGIPHEDVIKKVRDRYNL